MSYPLKGKCYKRSLFTCSGECSEFVDDTVSLGNWRVFQQHAASTHTSQLVQNWLSHKVDMFWSKEFWPPNSLKLNTLDFCEWSTVEIVTNKSRLPNFASLEATDEAAFVDMNCNILIRWRPGRKKVQQCIQSLQKQCRSCWRSLLDLEAVGRAMSHMIIKGDDWRFVGQTVEYMKLLLEEWTEDPWEDRWDHGPKSKKSTNTQVPQLTAQNSNAPTTTPIQ